jgi:hypothetical protein
MRQSGRLEVHCSGKPTTQMTVPASSSQFDVLALDPNRYQGRVAVSPCPIWVQPSVVTIVTCGCQLSWHPCAFGAQSQRVCNDETSDRLGSDDACIDIVMRTVEL